MVRDNIWARYWTHGKAGNAFAERLSASGDATIKEDGRIQTEDCVMTKAQLILTDASGIAEAAKQQHSIIVVYVTREEVERGTIGDVVDRLMALSDDPKLCRMYMGKLLVSFDGYNADPRELQEIPEVRRFLAAIHAQWPYWFYFMEPEHSAGTVTLSLVDVKRVTSVQADGLIGWDPDVDQLMALVDQCLRASGNIAAFCNADPKAYRDQMVAVLRTIMPDFQLPLA